MKKSKILFLGGLLFLFLTSFSLDVSEVYICKGPQSKKYHYKKDCRGLKNCSTDIYSVPLSDAKNLGRSLCGWED
ncbi:hypothetical protein AEQU3_01730 [Aequorivita antarctica]|uniref:Uncharacterized protein n=1 Tax=Aequorivita antarctica TaxID=153266 RepID=A0A5C6YYL9_9FLAO|nr:hypothetical protein ESU54_10920 [Aequorivita antarctica]SRX74750.1 hypothetical protein AEQU3_01730 [Aequorivita antarctica]